MCPRRTIELLDQLEKLGFADDAFARLHHRILHGESETIRNMCNYCRGIRSYVRVGNNARVRMRLEFVLEKARAHAQARVTSNEFLIFAQQSVRQYPIDHRSSMA